MELEPATKLLMVTTVPPTLEGFLLPFAERFRSLGWRVDAMAQGVSRNEACVKAFDRTWDVAWSRNPLGVQNLLRAPKQVREIVTREGYSLVHVHTPVASLVTRWALRPARKARLLKVLYTAHGFHFHSRGRMWTNLCFLALEKLAGPWTDTLAVINREDEEAARRHRLVPKDRLVYMPGIGIDLTRYRRDRVSESEVRAIRQELRCPEGTPLFLMIGEFVRNKRHEDAVKALAALPRKDVAMAFAGVGPLMGQIQAAANRLCVRDRVHFLGMRRDIPALLATSSALILPSAREGLPRSVMEALSMEIPVIGTDVRGTRDLLQDGCGILAPVGDVASLAAAMERVLNRPEEVGIMARKGHQRVSECDLQVILAGYEKLYRRALEELRGALPVDQAMF